MRATVPRGSSNVSSYLETLGCSSIRWCPKLGCSHNWHTRNAPLQVLHHRSRSMNSSRTSLCTCCSCLWHFQVSSYYSSRSPIFLNGLLLEHPSFGSEDAGGGTVIVERNCGSQTVFYVDNIFGDLGQMRCVLQNLFLIYPLEGLFCCQKATFKGKHWCSCVLCISSAG